MTDDFDKLFGAEFRNGKDVEALKKAILDDKKELIRLRKAIEDKVQNLYDQMAVARLEDYADIEDYCMELRIEELLELLGRKPEVDPLWEKIKKENWKQMIDIIIKGYDNGYLDKARVLSVAMKQLRGVVSGEEINEYLNTI